MSEKEKFIDYTMETKGYCYSDFVEEGGEFVLYPIQELWKKWIGGKL